MVNLLLWILNVDLADVVRKQWEREENKRKSGKISDDEAIFVSKLDTRIYLLKNSGKTLIWLSSLHYKVSLITLNNWNHFQVFAVKNFFVSDLKKSKEPFLKLLYDFGVDLAKDSNNKISFDSKFERRLQKWNHQENQIQRKELEKQIQETFLSIDYEFKL